MAMSVLVALALLEGAFRVTRYFVRGPNSDYTVNDPELGWVLNVKRPTVTRTNTCGEDVVTLPVASPYIIHYPRNVGGRRVLFLGDSTTHAYEVSTGAAYYDVVEAIVQGRNAVWAAGVGAYGNLQEYLLLEKIYAEINPEIVVWQLDANDVSDNVHRLDFSVLNHNVESRPYLDPASGAIELRHTASRLFKVSRGAAFLLSRLIGLDDRYGLGVVDRVESWMQPAANEMPGLIRQGLQVLDSVVADATRRYPGTRFAGFSVGSDYEEAYGDIFRRHGAQYWPNVSARVSAGAAHTDCSPWDPHWNRTGNRIAGEILASLLSAM